MFYDDNKYQKNIVKLILVISLLLLCVGIFVWKSKGAKDTHDCSKGGFSRLSVSSSSPEGNIVIDCDSQRKNEEKEKQK